MRTLVQVPRRVLREMPIRQRSEQVRWPAHLTGVTGVLDQPPYRLILVNGVLFDRYYPLGDGPQAPGGPPPSVC